MSPHNVWINDIIELTKPRICLLALMMASLGFLLGTPSGHFDGGLFLATLTGLGLVGAGCGALNQYLERDLDARMWRTMNRPLPAGRLAPSVALIVGFSASLIGEFVLLFGVNSVTAVLGGLTLLFYLGIYTPSKRVSSMSTLLGAIPGAMPPLMGWTASHGGVSSEGLLLFAILFLWQIPHFLSIAWIYREDYGRAGLPILSVVDEKGIATAKQIVLYSVVLLPLSLVPSLWGVTGTAYFYGALILGVIFLVYGLGMAVYRSKWHARRLFLVSIMYLPLLGVLMYWDRIR